MTPVELARACIDTPFRHQGRIPGLGMDCAGLVAWVAQQMSLTVLDEVGYSRLPHQGRLQAALDAQPCLAPVADYQAGDVLLMRFGSEPMHMGILAGDTLIHAFEPAGKVCEHIFDDEWRARVVRAYRFLEA